MKKNCLLLSFFVLLISACNGTKKTADSSNSLQGEWVLNYISGPRIAFDGLFPRQKPMINFDLAQSKVFGKNSCNNYSGKFTLDGDKINFNDGKMAVTMMACVGNGEKVYMSTLEKIDSYSISEDGKVLSLTGSGVPLMRFEKK